MVKHQNGYRLRLVYHKVPSFFSILFFLIHINDLSDNLVSTVKLFADETSLFFVVYDIIISANELNSDLQEISERTYK